MQKKSIVFDIGGTSMRVAPLSEQGVGETKKVPTPRTAKEGIAQIATFAREMCGENIDSAAGGFPGTIFEGNVLAAPNLPEWKGISLEGELSHALGGSAVTIRNDGDMAALGEAVYGAGKGKRIVAYIGIGTGVGCGRIVNGDIDSGMYGVEAGHQIIDAAHGTDLEAQVSGRAFEKRFGVHPKDAPREAYEEMTPVLATGMYNTILHWSPEILVLGGSMMNEKNGYRLDRIREALKRLPALPITPDIVLAKFKDTAGLEGARALLEK